MVSWSSMGRFFGKSIFKNDGTAPFIIQKANLSTSKLLSGDHGPRKFVVQPSRWQWHKFKDMFHYYLLVGLIPVGAIVFYSNVFIGPAQLTPIPDGYEPKHWEYHSHPITRFLAKYVHTNPQQDYEKFMHFLDEESQRIKLRRLEKDIKKKMAERQDYQAYYYRPMVNKYLRMNKKVGEELQDRLGENYDE